MSDCCILWWCWWETRHPGRTIILFTSPYATSPSLGLCIYGSYLTGINWKSLRVGSQTRKGGAGSLSSRLPSRFPTLLLHHTATTDTSSSAQSSWSICSLMGSLADCIGTTAKTAMSLAILYQDLWWWITRPITLSARSDWAIKS